MARGQSEPLFEGMVIRERVHHGPSEGAMGGPQGDGLAPTTPSKGR